MARGCARLVLLVGGLVACEPEASSPAGGPRVPADLEVVVLNPDRPPTMRCHPEIRIGEKVAADVLRSLSRDLLEREAADCEFGVATYYLPAMRPESGAWAIAELGPEISVSILGLSAADERTLLARAGAKGEVFGVWVDDTSYASVLSLYRDAGGIKLARWYPDGDQAIEPIRVSREGATIELRDAGRGSRGRRYRIGENGDLETWDGIGFLSAARNVRLDVDLASLIGEEESRRARRARVASAGRSLAKAEAAEERWRKFSEWLALYHTSLDPARHVVLSLGELTDADERKVACTRFAEILRAVPSDVRAIPARLDIDPLLAGLARLETACAHDREIQVLLESTAATRAWQELDRDVEKVVSALRPEEE